MSGLHVFKRFSRTFGRAYPMFSNFQPKMLTTAEFLVLKPCLLNQLGGNCFPNHT